MKTSIYHKLGKFAIAFYLVAVISARLCNCERHEKYNLQIQKQPHNHTGKWDKIYKSKELVTLFQNTVNNEIA